MSTGKLNCGRSEGHFTLLRLVKVGVIRLPAGNGGGFPAFDETARPGWQIGTFVVETHRAKVFVDACWLVG